ncbi:hypothetical protein [Methylobacterium sp. 1030]|uniref:hypothetical protein n=1 Tax=Methylobacterium sp. 1030 TaxID=3156404 RepID=UPI0033922EAB
MEDVIDKPKLGDPLDSYKGKWRYVAVTHDGKHWRSHISFETKERAERNARGLDRFVKTAENIEFLLLDSADGLFRAADYRYVIVLPDAE